VETQVQGKSQCTRIGKIFTCEDLVVPTDKEAKLLDTNNETDREA
jgi:hypothetical protein